MSWALGALFCVLYARPRVALRSSSSTPSHREDKAVKRESHGAVYRTFRSLSRSSAVYGAFAVYRGLLRSFAVSRGLSRSLAVYGTFAVSCGLSRSFAVGKNNRKEAKDEKEM